MARILMISSWVARGHVGLSAAAPVLNGLGVETVALPTVMLSNHPGHRHCAGASVPIVQLDAMLDALADNGWLNDIAAVLTGYFPSAEHVGFAAAAIARVEAANRNVHVCCDPVLGDDPAGLYVPEAVAEAVKDRLLPLAHSVTPNRFELQWLSGQSVATTAQAVTAARALAPPMTLATSVPNGSGELANVAVSTEGAWLSSTRLLAHVPHGTGDALAAAFLVSLLAGDAPSQAVAVASGRVDAIVAASAGGDELQLTSTRDVWPSARAATVTPLC